MKFKSIFFIFALAMLMLTGVAWAEGDDDQGDNDDQQNSTSITFHVYETDPTYFSTIKDAYGPGACVQVCSDVDVEMDVSGDDDEETTVGEALDDEGVLETLSEHYMDLVPSVVLICAFASEDYEDQLELVLQLLGCNEEEECLVGYEIQPTNVVKFRPGKKLRDSV